MLVWGIVGGLLKKEAPWGRIFRALPFADSPFAEAIVSFFEKPAIATVVAFILLYRFAEAHLVKLNNPFLLDTTEAGGLALSTGEVGLVYGTFGVLGLVAGGIIGGMLAARDGLKRWLWPMVLAINIPNAVYLWMATARPDSVPLISAAVTFETFGYGFGFTAFLLYLIHASDGPHKTAHYAICTGFMALGMMIPGMYSGWLEDLIGYPRFFTWVLLATIPSFVVASLVRVDPEFGKRDTTPDTPGPSDDAPTPPVTGAGTPTGAPDDAASPA
jgi:PAT family beta-lactamase induction signal transducer AmpG